MSRPNSNNLFPQNRLISNKRHILEPIEENDSSMEMEDMPIKNSRCRASTVGYDSPNCKESQHDTNQYTCDTYKQLNRYYAHTDKSTDKITNEIHLDNILLRLKNVHHKKFLDNHSINEKFRAKMIDWMIEVLKTFNQKEATVYRSIFLLDFYYYCARKTEEVDDLHLTGIACMMIASKSEEINYIRVEAFLNTIGKKKFSKEDLLRRELEVLSTIGFKTCGPTIYELLKCSFQLLDINNENLKAFFIKCTLVLTKMCLFSYQLINNLNLIEIALYCMIISLKMGEKMTGFSPNSQVI